MKVVLPDRANRLSEYLTVSEDVADQDDTSRISLSRSVDCDAVGRNYTPYTVDKKAKLTVHFVPSAAGMVMANIMYTAPYRDVKVGNLFSRLLLS